MKISLTDLVMALSNAIDLVSPVLTGHHSRVARIAVSIARQIGLSRKEQKDIFISGLLHDSGALSLKERLEAMHFEARNPSLHCEMGYQLLKSINILAKVAHCIRFHHVYWSRRFEYEALGIKIPIESHILHLSDRIDVLCDRNKEILGQSERIVEQILMQSERMFSPELVREFISLSKIEAFWLSIQDDKFFEHKRFIPIHDTLEFDEIEEIAGLFEKIIDFRSRFTSTHSSGVAAVAQELGKCLGLNEDECRKLKISGHLHDLGKLAVPTEILEKNGKLDAEEYNLIKSHTYYTYRVLDNIRGFEDIKEYASFHHERLNGEGYPFHIKDKGLSIGARIMAVSDIFTALTEDRPYRKGMETDSAIRIMDKMADEMAIDDTILMVLKDNIDRINETRKTAQEKAYTEYQNFIENALKNAAEHAMHHAGA